MYLVARPFTSYGKFYNAGDIVTDITSLRNPRLKLSEGKLFFIDLLKTPVMIDKVTKVAHYANLDANKLLIATGLKQEVVKPKPIPTTPVTPKPLSANKPQVG